MSIYHRCHVIFLTIFVKKLYQNVSFSPFFPGMYYGVSICLVSFASGLSVVTLNIYHRGVRGAPVPQIIRTVVLDKLAPLVFMNFHRNNSSSSSSNNSSSSSRHRNSQIQVSEEYFKIIIQYNVIRRAWCVCDEGVNI